MITALILAGGIGSRLGHSIPKQYLMVSGKPIIVYCMETIQNHPWIDRIVIVAAEEWRDSIRGWISEYGITKFSQFADPGASRQRSILNGLEAIGGASADAEDIVIIHDAVRPNVSKETLSHAVSDLAGYDGTLPVVAVKDTVFLSVDGNVISGLLNRNELYSGQTPESFCLRRFYDVHKNMSGEELDCITGPSQLAFSKNMKIKMYPGDENNFKITTQADYVRFAQYVKMKKEEQAAE